MIYALLFILGLAAGSFLNVVSMRYKPEQRLFDFKVIGGRSRCPNCRRELSAAELIPLISFLIQKGRCRSCGIRLSWQYPLIEALAGLIFVLVPLRLANLYALAPNEIFYFLSFLWILFFLALLLISIIDFRHYVIPDGMNWFIAGSGVIFVFVKLFSGYDFPFHGSFLSNYALVLSFAQGILANHFFGIIAGAGLFGLIIYLTKGTGMGFGDLKLAAALGLALGWPDVLFAELFAFLIGGIISAPLLFSGRKTMKSALPFGPFLASGVAVLFFAGSEILNWYFGLMGI